MQARMRKIIDGFIVVVLDNDALVHASTSSLMVRSYLTRVVFGRQEWEKGVVNSNKQVQRTVPYVAGWFFVYLRSLRIELVEGKEPLKLIYFSRIFHNSSQFTHKTRGSSIYFY